MPFRQTSVAGVPAIALRTEELEVVAVPAAGMRLTHLRRPRGREWLWGGASTDGADTGGWDEHFPTVAASPIPGAPPGSPSLPDGGDLRNARWTSFAYDHADGVTLAASATGGLLPYDFHRDVTLDPHQPVMRVRYRLRNTGGSPFPWIWSAHPTFTAQPGTTLELPTVAQVRLDTVHGLSDLAPGDIVSWPGALGGTAGRWTFPAGGSWAAKLFGDIGPSGRMTLTDPRRGERLEMVVDPEEVPQVGIWINNGGPAPTGQEPDRNLALAPSIGAPDRLDQAVREWGTAQTLQPGEVRSWGFQVWLLEEGDPSPS